MSTTSLKATGLVRKFDELGRFIVPKEILRMLGIQDNDPIEIFTNNEGEIILKKYSPIGEVVGTSGGYYIHKGAGKMNFLDLAGKINFVDGYDHKELREARK